MIDSDWYEWVFHDVKPEKEDSSSMDEQRETERAVSIFYSYADEDERLQKQLETHLGLLRQQHIINEWHKRKLMGGADWEDTTDAHFNTASVILLLISPAYLASNYCYSIEMLRALERHEQSKAIVIPILLRPVDLQGAPFAHLQCLPPNKKPITKWSNKDEAFEEVARGIRSTIEYAKVLSPKAPKLIDFFLMGCAVGKRLIMLPTPPNFDNGDEGVLSEFIDALARSGLLSHPTIAPIVEIKRKLILPTALSPDENIGDIIRKYLKAMNAVPDVVRNNRSGDESKWFMFGFLLCETAFSPFITLLFEGDALPPLLSDTSSPPLIALESLLDELTISPVVRKKVRNFITKMKKPRDWDTSLKMVNQLTETVYLSL